MEVKVKYLNNKVKDLYLKASDGKAEVPFKTYEKDFCYDVVATSCEEIAPNVYKYKFGLAFEIVRGDHQFIGFGDYDYPGYGLPNTFDIKPKKINVSIDARPRSSIWKTGMILANCEGTIDELYRGECAAIFYHLMPNMPKYEVGDKICQIKLGFTLPIEFSVVDELSETERGDGGFGSTGK